MTGHFPPRGFRSASAGLETRNHDKGASTDQTERQSRAIRNWRGRVGLSRWAAAGGAGEETGPTAEPAATQCPSVGRTRTHYPLGRHAPARERSTDGWRQEPGPSLSVLPEQRYLAPSVGSIWRHQQPARPSSSPRAPFKAGLTGLGAPTWAPRATSPDRCRSAADTGGPGAQRWSRSLECHWHKPGPGFKAPVRHNFKRCFPWTTVDSPADTRV